MYVYKDFELETIRDYGRGELYGVEKFWAFLKYYKDAKEVPVSSDMYPIMKNFRTLDDFKRAVSWF